jgi:hypothetical protein
MKITSGRGKQLAGVVGLAGLTLAVTPPAGAQSIRYTASAAADGARLSVTVPGATVVDQIIDGGGPTAQAMASSLGSSSALAAQPYPGELAIIGPGLGASLIGAPQPPAYPFVAASRHPSAPEQKVEPNPGYSLVARSGEDFSDATARSGSGNDAGKVLLTEATASVKATADHVSAEAANRVEALTVGPLAIGSVLSSARVSRKPDTDPERASSLVVTGVSIAGQPVGFTEAGFVVAGTAVPLPPSDPLLAALSSAGVALSYLKADSTPTGVIAPGLRIVTRQEVPGAGRTATVSLTLGRASAGVEASSEAIELPADAPPTPVDQSENAGPAATTSAATSTTDAAPIGIALPGPSTPAFDLTPVVSAASSADPVAASPSPDPSSADGAVVAPAAPAAGEQAIQLAHGPVPVGRVSAGSSFYPLLVLAGLVVWGGSHILRTVGVNK